MSSIWIPCITWIYNSLRSTKSCNCVCILPSTFPNPHLCLRLLSSLPPVIFVHADEYSWNHLRIFTHIFEMVQTLTLVQLLNLSGFWNVWIHLPDCTNIIRLHSTDMRHGMTLMYGARSSMPPPVHLLGVKLIGVRLIADHKFQEGTAIEMLPATDLFVVIRMMGLLCRIVHRNLQLNMEFLNPQKRIVQGILQRNRYWPYLSLQRQWGIFFIAYINRSNIILISRRKYRF